MENDNGNVTVTTRQHKSNAPWILGIIAFVAGFPFGEVFVRAEAVKKALGMTTPEQRDDTGKMLGIFLLVSFISFLSSFWGKSEESIGSGILMIFGSLYIFYACLAGPVIAAPWGLVTGIGYLIGGIFSIINKNRIK
ncbi:MAG: hypothetical protein J5806_10850 [Lentisphaeria bacterium]|nr:hypothetical protein [Lentisphaeria bacterium]